MKTRFVSVVLTILLNVFTPLSNFSQNLSPGDIAFLGFNADDLDAFAIIALTDIPGGSEIYFTDNGWQSDNTFRTGEGTIKWTAPQGGVLAKTVISFYLNSGWKSSIGDIIVQTAISLSASGDQILAYQNNTGITFIAAIHFDGLTGWQDNATSSNTSKIPLGLINNVTALAISEIDNAVYCGNLSDTQSNLLSKINNSALWYTDDNYRLPMSVEDFPCNVWIGTTTDWNLPTNWFTTELPDDRFHTYIPANKSTVISSSTQVTIKKITLEAASSLTVKSDENTTGSLITKLAAGTGTINIERYIPSANWHLISSPVSGQGLAAFGALAGNAIGLYEDVDPDEYDLASYKESNDTWTYVQVGGSGDFGKAAAYSMHRTAAGTVTFSGSGIYTGNQSIGITCGATTNGWNCIGNPYTSAIDAAAFLSVNAAGIDNSFEWIYLWDQSAADGAGDYTQITSGTIPVGQGFFVNSVVGDATINFTSAMQTTGGEFKSSEIPWPTIQLIAQAENLSNTTTINFNSSMTRGLDPGHDGGKLKGNPDIALYTRLLEDNGIDFAIQALPEITAEPVRIPVGLDFVPGGEISFMAETSAFPVDALVYIEDLQTKSTTLLNAKGAKYTVTLPVGTKGAGRFNLLVTKSATTVKTVPENLFNVYTRGNTITINGPANSNTEISLYSIDGKQWMSRRAGSMNQNTIDASAFPAGIYMLNISHEGTRTVKKIVLTK